MVSPAQAHCPRSVCSGLCVPVSIFLSPQRARSRITAWHSLHGKIYRCRRVQVTLGVPIARLVVSSSALCPISNLQRVMVVLVCARADGAEVHDAGERVTVSDLLVNSVRTKRPCFIVPCLFSCVCRYEQHKDSTAL